MLETDPSLATFRPIERARFPMDGWTPLHYAAVEDNVPVIEVGWPGRCCVFYRGVLQWCAKSRISTTL